MSRILIVEDDPAILCRLRDNLEFESHQVLTAADGEAGYRTLCEHSPDLVILDLKLPKLSGYDLCKRVRGEGFNAPILMLLRARRRAIECWASTSAPTTTSPSRFRCANCWRGSVRYCAMRRSTGSTKND
jgi:CheY-like chemotaxis protein